MIEHTKVFYVVIVLLSSLLVSDVFADPAPPITSFDVIAVCTGNDAVTAQCIDTSSTPYYITLPGNSGAKLFVITQQKGYAASQSATYIGTKVNSVRTIFIYNPYPVVSGFVDYWDCGILQTGTFSATAKSINNYQDWNASIAIVVNPVLSVNMLGTGSGTVTPDTGTFTWSGKSGTANYAANTLVNLTATSSAGSSFDGWSGACTNISGDCAITMNTNKSVSATFTVIPNARIGSTPYGTLTNAYNAVATNEIIEAKDMTFVENLALNRDVPFTLIGGYADDYGSRTGFTILNGVLTISNGSMIVDGLIIRP